LAEGEWAGSWAGRIAVRDGAARWAKMFAHDANIGSFQQNLSEIEVGMGQFSVWSLKSLIFLTKQ
jgi:hypothetical protein